MGQDLLHATCERCKQQKAMPSYVCEMIIDHVIQTGQRIVIENVSDLQTFANNRYMSFDEFTVHSVTMHTGGEQEFIDAVRERVRFAGPLN